MEWRNPWTFWAAVLGTLVLVCVPTYEWARAAGEYGALLGALSPAPLRPTRPRLLPHRAPEPALDLRPVEFRRREPRARAVELVGDFNGWAPGLLRMARGRDGTWSLVVPVAPGRRRYLFLVDGEPRLDEGASTAEGPEGRRVSERLVR